MRLITKNSYYARNFAHSRRAYHFLKKSQKDYLEVFRKQVDKKLVLEIKNCNSTLTLASSSNLYIIYLVTYPEELYVKLKIHSVNQHGKFISLHFLKRKLYNLNFNLTNMAISTMLKEYQMTYREQFVYLDLIMPEKGTEFCKLTNTIYLDNLDSNIKFVCRQQRDSLKINSQIRQIKFYDLVGSSLNFLGEVEECFKRTSIKQSIRIMNQFKLLFLYKMKGNLKGEISYEEALKFYNNVDSISLFRLLIETCGCGQEFQNFITENYHTRKILNQQKKLRENFEIYLQKEESSNEQETLEFLDFPLTWTS